MTIAPGKHLGAAARGDTCRLRTPLARQIRAKELEILGIARDGSRRSRQLLEVEQVGRRGDLDHVRADGQARSPSTRSATTAIWSSAIAATIDAGQRPGARPHPDDLRLAAQLGDGGCGRRVGRDPARGLEGGETDASPVSARHQLILTPK
ncbi:MAG: hypothetical protein KJ066_21835 [Acidobacteria bacterium]|nr:hypothetical protein [Acidobacteriota bacterium]